jgi:hypothetical protein
MRAVLSMVLKRVELRAARPEMEIPRIDELALAPSRGGEAIAANVYGFEPEPATVSRHLPE